MFNLLRATFKQVAGVAALFGLPGLVLVGLGMFGIADFWEVMRDPTLVEAQVTTSFDDAFTPGVVTVLGIGFLLTWLGSAAVVPALVKVGVDHWEDRPPSITAALAVGLRRVWGIATVWLAMLMVVLVAVALPGVLATQAGPFALLYILVLPVLLVFGPALIMLGYLVPAMVVAEDIGAWAALGRVRRLLRGHFWPTYGRGLLVGLLVGIVSSVFSAATNFFVFLPAEVVAVLFVLSMFANYLVVTPLGVYGGLALYGDLRIRSEGADVLALAAWLDR